jgi:hypothetical protein
MRKIADKKDRGSTVLCRPICNILTISTAYNRGGQTFWIAGQISRKNSVAGRKKFMKQKLCLFLPKRGKFYMFTYRVMS